MNESARFPVGIYVFFPLKIQTSHATFYRFASILSTKVCLSKVWRSAVIRLQFTTVSEKVFVSLFTVSTCLYDKLTNDKLTNDWPQGTAFFCHFLQCTCKSVLLDKEIAFVESLNFNLNVSRNAAEQMKESLIQIWIRYQLDHPPIPLLVSSDDSLMCEEDMSWMLL